MLFSVTYLKEKWAIFFGLVDFNKDKLLNSLDLDILLDNVVRLNNLTEPEVYIVYKVHERKEKKEEI